MLLDGKYELDRLLGEGGYGKVYSGRNLSTGQSCAVKVSLDKFEFDSTDDDPIESLKREFNHLCSIPPHPNCIRVFGAGENYYVMEKFGLPLSSSAFQAERTKPQFIYDVMVGIFRALSHYHKNGFLHLDLKPSNILASLDWETGRVNIKIIDPLCPPPFETSSEDFFFGTPEYAAPEFMEGKEGETLKADLYSVGLILYELLMSRRAFNAKSAEEHYWLHRDAVYKPVCPSWHWSIRLLVDDLLNPDPSLRPKDARRCLRRLKLNRLVRRSKKE